jgi:hypothetical protein
MLLSLLFACTPHPADDKPADSADSATDTDTTTTGTCNDENESCEPGTCSGSGSRMLPGADCLACHSVNGADEAPRWTIAGTAFIDRFGSAALNGATVRVTGADGATIELTTNIVGNFYTSEHVEKPYTAEVEVDGDVLTMPITQEYGGCNECHACDGTAGGKLYGP